jgi:hypothetical protein
MADIDIVPKREAGSWMWVLLAFVLLALVLWMVMAGGDAARRNGVSSPSGARPSVETPRSRAA